MLDYLSSYWWIRISKLIRIPLQVCFLMVGTCLATFYLLIFLLVGFLDLLLVGGVQIRTSFVETKA